MALLDLAADFRNGSTERAERDGTGENSSENWTLHEFFSPIVSLGPSRIRRCIVLPEQTKTRIIRTLISNELTYKTGAFRAILVLKINIANDPTPLSPERAGLHLRNACDRRKKW